MSVTHSVPAEGNGGGVVTHGVPTSPSDVGAGIHDFARGRTLVYLQLCSMMWTVGRSQITGLRSCTSSEGHFSDAVTLWDQQSEINLGQIVRDKSIERLHMRQLRGRGEFTACCV